MELRHLRYFIAVGHCLNFTKAAELLHISQPPLSRQIQEFEEEVGAPLFDRSGKKTSLTKAGEYLLIEAERILDEIESSCRTAKAIAEEPRSLNIGCVSFLLNAYLTPLLEEIKRRIPNRKIEIRTMSTEAQERMILTGSLDFGFVRSWGQEDQLIFEPIAEETLSLIYPSGEASGSSPGECLQSLEGKPFISTSKVFASGLSSLIAEACADYGVAPPAAYECNDAFSIIGLVSNGLGWSIVPDLELRDAIPNGIGVMPLPPRKITTGICYRENGLSPQADEFLRIAKAFFSRTGRQAGLS